MGRWRGSIQLYEDIVQLKLKATDEKQKGTDVADMQGIFRIIQSVPFPKAELFKMWLEEVWKEWNYRSRINYKRLSRYYS